jgi:hypothetical protein
LHNGCIISHRSKQVLMTKRTLSPTPLALVPLSAPS